MKVILKNIKHEEFEIEVPDDSCTIYQVKKQIESQFNFDHSKIQLLFNGIILSNENTMKEYQINGVLKLFMTNIKLLDQQACIEIKEQVTSDKNVTKIQAQNLNNVEILEEKSDDDDFSDFDEDEDADYSADIKASEAIKIVSSIMKVLCTKNPQNAKMYFQTLENDNPEIRYLLKKNEVEFKSLLYSPVTADDKIVFKQFYRGQLNVENNNSTTSNLISGEEIDTTSQEFNDVKRLMDFGFTARQAKEALTVCKIYMKMRDATTSGKTYNSAKTAQDSTAAKDTKKDSMESRDLARLVDYYRMRIDSFEKERIEWLEKLEGCKISQEEYHKTEWELRKRTDEIAELQNALSESNISLNQERKKVIHLNAELENCQIRTKDDRRRLIQILQLAEPIEQTIKLFYDRRPEKLEKYSNFNLANENDYDPNSVALMKSLKKYPENGEKIKRHSTPSARKLKARANKTGLEYRIPPSDEKQQIIRTVMFPNDSTNNTMNEENDFLRKQLQEMKLKYENHIMKLEEDRKLREEEFRLQYASLKEENEKLLKKNQKLEKLNYETTKDYMELKYDTGINEKKLYEEMELTKLQNQALEFSLKDVVSKTNIEKEQTKQQCDKKATEIAKVMRSQVKSQEENMNIIKEQYRQIQKIYTTKVKELESQLKNITDKYKALENKKTNEIEGYINEIRLMRKRLKSYEDYAYKLRKMTDGVNDRYEEINEATRANNDKFLSQSQKTQEELNNLEERLQQYNETGKVQDYDSNNDIQENIEGSQEERNSNYNNYNEENEKDY